MESFLVEMAIPRPLFHDMGIQHALGELNRLRKMGFLRQEGGIQVSPPRQALLQKIEGNKACLIVMGETITRNTYDVKRWGEAPERYFVELHDDDSWDILVICKKS